MRTVIYNWLMQLLSFFSPFWEEEELVEELPKKRTSKKYDCSKFTRQDYDIIMYEYNLYQDCKAVRDKDFKSSLDDVVIKLNEILGYDKSRTTYTRVWTGKVSRNDLKDASNV
jgi:hypothetical protein